MKQKNVHIMTEVFKAIGIIIIATALGIMAFTLHFTIGIALLGAYFCLLGWAISYVTLDGRKTNYICHGDIVIKQVKTFNNYEVIKETEQFTEYTTRDNYYAKVPIPSSYLIEK